MIVQTIVGQEIETPTNKKLARAPLRYFNPRTRRSSFFGEIVQGSLKKKVIGYHEREYGLFQITDFTSFITPRLKDFKTFGVRLLFPVIEHTDWVLRVVGVGYNRSRIQTPKVKRRCKL